MGGDIFVKNLLMKNPKRDEMVVMATCQKTGKHFGITAVRKGRDYHFVWAFKLSASAARKEGFDRNKVSGNIINDSEFPGCPYCGAESWFQCGTCKRFVCSENKATYGKCPECGGEGSLVVGDNFDLSGDAF